MAPDRDPTPTAEDPWVRIGLPLVEILAALLAGSVLAVMLLIFSWGLQHPGTLAALLTLGLLLCFTVSIALIVAVRLTRVRYETRRRPSEGSAHLQALLDALTDQERAELATYFKRNRIG